MAKEEDIASSMREQVQEALETDIAATTTTTTTAVTTTTTTTTEAAVDLSSKKMSTESFDVVPDVSHASRLLEQEFQVYALKRMMILGDRPGTKE